MLAPIMAADAGRDESASPQNRSFQDRFCAEFQCSAEDFQVAALRMFLHPPWSSVFPLINATNASFFAVDLKILKRLGAIDNWSIFVNEVRTIRSDYQREKDFGFARKHLRLRLSSERILTMAWGLWSAKQSEPDATPERGEQGHR